MGEIFCRMATFSLIPEKYLNFHIFIDISRVLIIEICKNSGLREKESGLLGSRPSPYSSHSPLHGMIRSEESLIVGRHARSCSLKLFKLRKRLSVYMNVSPFIPAEGIMAVYLIPL